MKECSEAGRHGVLGLFPSLDGPGGVQRSGSIAWSAILNDRLPRQWSQSTDLYLFQYGGPKRNIRPATSGSERLKEFPPINIRSIRARSKSMAVLAAMRWRPQVQTVIVWHLALLRLLPFFRFKKNPKIVLFLHGIEAWRGHDWLTRKMLEKVNLFLANSGYTWNRFLTIHPTFANAQHRVVHLGVGACPLEPPPPPSDPPVVLMIGRLIRSEDYKGHREMILTWPLVLDQIPDAQLWIVGEGDLRSELETLVRERQLTHRIRFSGELSEEKKQGLLEQCRCFALPSRAEGFGLVYLEAMRMGRPCLVSDLDAGREIVRPPLAGLAADPSNATALAEAACRLLNLGPEWQNWSTQGQRLYESYYTGRHFQERLLNALHQATSERFTFQQTCVA